jgi:hypothetical protein
VVVGEDEAVLADEETGARRAGDWLALATLLALAVVVVTLSLALTLAAAGAAEEPAEEVVAPAPAE